MGIFAPAYASDYILDTHDKLQVRIIEWRVVDGTFFEWPAVSGDYTIDTSGSLSLPFAGQLPVRGKTTKQVSDMIADKLQQEFGLSKPPEASVQLVEYRPFFVAGDVQQPGFFPYVPGLTVLKAITFAGGLPNNLARGTEREVINAKGDLDVLASERVFLLAKRARLLAEEKGSSEIPQSEELNKNAGIQSVVADEDVILKVRRRKIDLQLQALADLRSLLELEVKSMEQKITTQQRQVDLAREEFEKVGSLARKGLVVSTRMLSSERTVADLEGRLLDLETAILKAKQSISETQQDEIDIRNSFETEVVTELQSVEMQLNEVALKIRTKMDLLSETLVVATSQTSTDDRDEPVEYLLVRSTDGQSREIAATESTEVQPGDVLKVRLNNFANIEASFPNN